MSAASALWSFTRAATLGTALAAGTIGCARFPLGNSDVYVFPQGFGALVLPRPATCTPASMGPGESCPAPAPAQQP